MTAEQKTTKQPKQLDEADALVKIKKLLNQLSPESRRKVLAFLAQE